MCLFHDYWVTLSNSRAWFRQTTWVVLRHLISTQEAKPQNQIINKSFRQSCTIFGEFLLAFSNYLETLLTCLYVFSNFPNYQILTTDLRDLDPLICPELNLPTWLVPTKATLGLPPAPPPPRYAPGDENTYWVCTRTHQLTLNVGTLQAVVGGDIVVMMSDKTKEQFWKLARVKELLPWQFLPNFHSCFYNCNETKCFLFLNVPMKRKFLFDIFVDKWLKIRFLLLKLNVAPFYNSKISVKPDKSYATKIPLCKYLCKVPVICCIQWRLMTFVKVFTSLLVSGPL